MNEHFQKVKSFLALVHCVYAINKKNFVRVFLVGYFVNNSSLDANCSKVYQYQ